MPEISVIIVNWNGRPFLDDCLGAMRRQTFRDFETIVVDNGSGDGSAEYIRKKFPEVKLVVLPENLGFTGGNIAGYNTARGGLIVLLNNDTEADSEWLQEIFQASVDYPEAGSFASKMMYFDARQRIENCGFDLCTSGDTVDLGRDEPDGPAWRVPCQVFGPCGGAAAYRRSMLEEIGFLDPDFFAVYEDVDLSFRAQLRGYSCVYVPQAIVFHRYRATLGVHSPQHVFYSQRNVEYVYVKNMPLSLILRSIPQRFAYEVGAAIHFTRVGQGRAFLKSKWSALRQLPALLRKRREIQSSRSVYGRRILALMKPTFSIKWKKFLHQSFPKRVAS